MFRSALMRTFQARSLIRATAYANCIHFYSSERLIKAKDKKPSMIKSGRRRCCGARWAAVGHTLCETVWTVIVAATRRARGKTTACGSLLVLRVCPRVAGR